MHFSINQQSFIQRITHQYFIIENNTDKNFIITLTDNVSEDDYIDIEDDINNSKLNKIVQPGKNMFPLTNTCHCYITLRLESTTKILMANVPIRDDEIITINDSITSSSRRI